jgi:hypothetical protein
VLVLARVPKENAEGYHRTVQGEDLPRGQGSRLWNDCPRQVALFGAKSKERALSEISLIAESTYRREFGRIIAKLIRICGSIDLAEDALQDAFASRMVNKSEHIEIPEVGCPRFANVKRQLEAEDARETRVFNGLLNGSMRRVCAYRVFNRFALFDHTHRQPTFATHLKKVLKKGK